MIWHGSGCGAFGSQGAHLMSGILMTSKLLSANAGSAKAAQSIVSNKVYVVRMSFSLGLASCTLLFYFAIESAIISASFKQRGANGEDSGW